MEGLDGKVGGGGGKMYGKGGKRERYWKIEKGSKEKEWYLRDSANTDILFRGHEWKLYLARQELDH